ncbi:DUF423 domain-containing protein [Planktothrix serta]|nr:DUF423 domain-containing protein [Planktothrix serta]
MSKLFLVIASIFGGLSVMAGAFGSHYLKGQLTPPLLEIFTTATRYQMYHALALLFVGILFNRSETPQPWLIAAGWAFITGIGLFSGSLYALSLTGMGWLGMITPIGGIALICGWACLTIASLKS